MPRAAVTTTPQRARGNNTTGACAGMRRAGATSTLNPKQTLNPILPSSTLPYSTSSLPYTTLPSTRTLHPNPKP